MSDGFSCKSIASEQLRSDLSGVIVVKYHRRMRNVQSRHLSFIWKRLCATTAQVGMVRQEFQDDAGPVLHFDFPFPVYFLTFIVLASLETDLLEIVFQRPVCLRVFQNNKVDHHIEVERAGMLRYDGQSLRDQVSGREPAD